MRSQVNMTWNKMSHHRTIFFSSDHGVTYFSFSWHAMTKLHAMNLLFKKIPILSKTNFDINCHDTLMHEYKKV